MSGGVGGGGVTGATVRMVSGSSIVCGLVVSLGPGG